MELVSSTKRGYALSLLQRGIENLMMLNPAEGSAEMDLLRMIAAAVDDYERHLYPDLTLFTEVDPDYPN